MDLKEVRELLNADIETRVMPKTKYPYIPASAIRDRLNDTFKSLWSTKILSSEIINDDTVVVKLRLTAHVDNHVIIKEDIGSAVIHKYSNGVNKGKYTNIGDSYSNAVFDAVKSCAKALGIGNKDMDVYKDGNGKYVRHCDKKPAQSGSKDTAKVPSGSKDTAKVPSGSKDTAKVPSGSKDTAKVPSGSKDTAKVPSGSKDTAKVPSGSKDTAKVPSGSKDTAKVPSGSKDTAKVPSGSKDTAKVPSGSKDTAKVPSGSKDTANIPADEKETPNIPADEEKTPNIPADEEETPLVKSDLICPVTTGTFGEDNDNFGECDACKNYAACCKKFFEMNKEPM